jgi:hypothetical protein
MGLQRFLDRLDDVVAAIFARDHKMVAEYRARTDVDDREQPNPLDFELVREAERIGYHDLEPDVELVSIELHDLIRPDGRWRAGHLIRARQAFKV